MDFDYPRRVLPSHTDQDYTNPYGMQIYLENLQEKGDWHFNLITYPNLGIGKLSDAEIEENLRTKLPEGGSFMELFWPEKKTEKPKWSEIVKACQGVKAETITISKVSKEIILNVGDKMSLQGQSFGRSKDEPLSIQRKKK